MDEVRPNDRFLGKTVLIVDDESALRSSLGDFLKNVGFKVLEAADGAVAKSIATLNAVDVIISDVRMPKVNGIELLHHIKRTKPIPFLLMTGFSDIMEAKEAFSIGADNFLPKPFTQDELFNALNLILPSPGPKVETPNLEKNFCKVPIEEFTSSSKLKVDVYLKLSDAKYLRVATQSSELSAERLLTYKEKGLNFLYIRREDFPKYVGLNIRIAKAASQAESLSRQQKFHVLKHTTEVLLQDSYINGLDREKFETAKDAVTLVMEAMSQDEDLFSLLEKLNANADFLYAHCLGVSLYSTLMVEALEWSSTSTKSKVSMGGLVHDIGKKELDRNILEKSRKDLDRNELKLYESHPCRSRDILSQIPSVPSDVVFIALQHHENCIGTGYPSQLTKDQIHPLARLVSVANRFCEQTLKSPNFTPFPPHEAINRMLSFNENEFDPVFVCALMKLFNHPALPKYAAIVEKAGRKTAK